jgi:FMN reductase
MNKIIIISAGLGQPSATQLLGDRLGTATVAALRDRNDDAAIEVVELRSYAQDLATSLVTGFPSARLAALIERVIGADGLVAVTPVFSASYSGLFKMFFDLLQPESLAGKPTLIAATGGTARHSLMLEHAMRPLFAYLRTIVVPTAVFAATDDFGQTSGSGRSLAERIDRAADELAALLRPATARTSAPKASVPQVTPFAELLARGRDRRTAPSTRDLAQ